MPKSILHVFSVAALLVATACGGASSSATPPATPAPTQTAAYTPTEACSAEDAAVQYPGANWTETDAARLGWSRDGVARVLDVAQHGHWSAGMIVAGGQVIGRFGDLTEKHDMRSIRKSFMGAVIGQLAAEGRLSLDATLADMHIDDAPPLSAREKTATLRQLLESRSGVYHDAAFTTEDERASQPPRDRDAPGSVYWYNNWGFNALGTIVHNATGRALGNVIDQRIAHPLGMQDFSAADLHDQIEPMSRHGAYRIWMSTRDRARFGYLYLHHGCWAGRQIVPAAWVADSVFPHTNREQGDDFGYVWRSDDPVARVGMTQRFFYSRGNPLQYIMVVPEWDVVVVLTADMDHPGWVNWMRTHAGLLPKFDDFRALLGALGAARPQP